MNGEEALQICNEVLYNARDTIVEMGDDGRKEVKKSVRTFQQRTKMKYQDVP